MDKTNQELWEEALRTAELLDAIRPTLKPMESALFDLSTTLIDKDKLPIDYVSDAQILTSILLKLKARGAKIT